MPAGGLVVVSENFSASGRTPGGLIFRTKTPDFWRFVSGILGICRGSLERMASATCAPIVEARGLNADEMMQKRCHSLVCLVCLDESQFKHPACRTSQEPKATVKISGSMKITVRGGPDTDTMSAVEVTNLRPSLVVTLIVVRACRT